MAKAKKVGVFAFAFGVDCVIMSNVAIAKRAAHAAEYFDAMVFTQLDVHLMGVSVEYFKPVVPGVYLSTLDLSRWMAKRAKEERLTEIRIVAAQPHVWRCLRDVRAALRAERLNILVSVYEFSDDSYQHSDIWFCPESEQWYTRTPLAWWCREIILRCLPFGLYSWVTSACEHSVVETVPVNGCGEMMP